MCLMLMSWSLASWIVSDSPLDSHQVLPNLQQVNKVSNRFITLFEIESLLYSYIPSRPSGRDKYMI